MISNQAVFVLKYFFDYDDSLVKPMLTGLKAIATSQIEYLKKKQKADFFLSSLKKYSRGDRNRSGSSGEKYGYTDISAYYEDFLMLQEDFPFGPD
jgi:hypothetical protein